MEVKFSAHLNNKFFHCIYDSRKFFRSDMRMCVSKNIGICAEFGKNLKNSGYIPAFVTSRVKFTVGKSTCSSLTKAVVRVRVYDTSRTYFSNVFSSSGCFITSFNDNRGNPIFKQCERAE